MGASTNRAFPWESNGITFASRGELERIVERFAGAGSKKHLSAAQTLLREALNSNKISADQYNDIKVRLHL